MKKIRKQTIEFISNELNLNSIKEVANLNKRPESKYFLGLHPQLGEVHIKINPKKHNLQQTSSLLKFLHKHGYPNIKPVTKFNHKDNQITVTKYLEGKPLQKQQYSFLDKKYFTSLKKFILFHYHFLALLKNKKIKDTIAINQITYLNKLEKYRIQLKESPLSTDDILDEKFNLLNKSYKLTSSEYTLQHGDFYGSNIIINQSDKYFLVDWDNVCITSKYFDIATFIAKHLNSEKLIGHIYKKIYDQLNNKEKLNFNSQILIALIKEYRNLYILKPSLIKIKRLTEYKKVLERKLPKLIKQYPKQFKF